MHTFQPHVGRAHRFTPRPQRVARRSTLALLTAISGCILAFLPACVQEGPPERQAPSTSIPAQPDNLHVNRVVFTVAQVLEDRDRNGYYDTIPATAYLFDTHYAYSIRVPGTFLFALTEPTSGKTIARWEVPWQDASKAQTMTWTGTIFPFQLDIREARRPSSPTSGPNSSVPASTATNTPAPSPPPSTDPSSNWQAGDRLPATEVLLGCTFVPQDPSDKPVECGSRLTVLIGKTR